MSSKTYFLKSFIQVLGFYLKLILTIFLLLLTYLFLIFLTNGCWQGRLAAILATLLAVGCYTLFQRNKKNISGYRLYSLRIMLVAFIAALIYTVYPVASTNQPKPAIDFSQVPTRFWNLKTGSKIAYYHIMAANSAPKKTTPIIFLHGGPGAYVRKLDLTFFAKFAQDGYDVYLYDQAGSGRSSLLPKEEYSHARNIVDFEAIIDQIGANKYIVIGQSYGGSLLAHLTANEKTSKRIFKAIYAEPGITVLSHDTAILAKSPNAGLETVTLPGRLFLGMMINPKGGFNSQNESINYTLAHPELIQGLFQQSFPKTDRKRIPLVETGVINFSVIGIVPAQVSQYNTHQEGDYKKFKVPSMLMLGESSYIDRQAPMDLLRINPNIQRVQYFKGVGHILWNGLDNHNEQVKKAIDEFLNNQEPGLPNYPQKNDINSFLVQKL